MYIQTIDDGINKSQLESQFSVFAEKNNPRKIIVKKIVKSSIQESKCYKAQITV